MIEQQLALSGSIEHQGSFHSDGVPKESAQRALIVSTQQTVSETTSSYSFIRKLNQEATP